MIRWSRLPFSTSFILAMRNMASRKMRSALTAFGIIIGVAAMVSVSTTNASTLNSISQFFDEASGQSDLLIEAALNGESFDESVLNQVRRQPEVQAAAPLLLGITFPADELDQWDLQFGAGGNVSPGSNFWLMGIDPAIDARVHDYRLTAGRLLEENETAYNVVLVDEYAADKKLALGNDLVLITPNGPAELRVVGLIAEEGIGVSNDGILGITPLNVVQELFNEAGQIGQIEVVVSDELANDGDELDALRRRMQQRLGDDLDVKYPASRGQSVTGTLETYQLGLNFFSAVSLFVGSFLIYNAFAMTVVERSREIGMMRAVGMTRRQVISLVLIEAIILGILGSLLGAALGLLLARGLIVSMSGFTGQEIQIITATTADLRQAVLIGLLVTIAAALLPAIQAARTSPLQALRIQANIDEGRWAELGWKFGPLTITASLLIMYRVPLKPDLAFIIGSNAVFTLLLGATLCIPILSLPMERLTRPLTVFLFQNEGRLGNGNINRARGRTTLTVAALMVGIAMVVGINGLTASFEVDLQDWIDTSLGGDLFVRSPLDMRPDLEARLLAVDGISAVTRQRYVLSRYITGPGESETVIFSAIDPETYLSVAGLQIEDGPNSAETIRRLAQGNAVMVDTILADKYYLQPGDTVRLETRRGQRDFEVAAVIVELSGGQTPLITGSWNDLRRYYGINDVSRFTVKLAPGASLPQVSEIIENDVGRSQNATVETRGEFEEKIRQLSGEAFALFDVLGLVGLVVAALGVMNTMLMNVLERTRELGGLRSLGMTRRQVMRMILAEALAMGLMGAVFGLTFGVVLIDVFVIGLRQMGGFALERVIPVPPLFYSFFVALIVALLAAWYPARRAARVNIIEAIKNE